jgi:hypothetical protein
MTARDDLLASIRESLAWLYVDRAIAHRVARDAGLIIQRIAYDPTPHIHWDNILREADKQRLVLTLLDIALTEYGSRIELRRLRQQFFIQEYLDSLPSEAQYDVALTYVLEDSEAVNRLHHSLVTRRVTVFHDLWIPGYQDWQRLIGLSLPLAPSFVVVAGQNTPSKWWNDQCETAFRLQSTGSNLSVVPAILPGAPQEIVDYLTGKGFGDWADLRTEHGESNALAVIVRGTQEARSIHQTDQGMQRRPLEICKQKLVELQELTPLLEKEVVRKIQWEIMLDWLKK